MEFHFRRESLRTPFNNEHRKAFKGLVNSVDEVYQDEVSKFFYFKFDYNCYDFISACADRCQVVRYSQVNKIDFMFDSKIVFSCELKNLHGQHVVQVNRYYY